MQICLPSRHKGTKDIILFRCLSASRLCAGHRHDAPVSTPAHKSGFVAKKQESSDARAIPCKVFAGHLVFACM